MSGNHAINRYWSLQYWILLAAGMLICLERWYTFTQPLEWDLATYTLVGRQLLEGKRLYLDVWDIKPPGIFVVHAAAQGLLGDGLGMIFILGCVVAAGTMLAIYCTLAPRNRWAAATAATGYAIVSADLALEANRANTEAYINLLLACGCAVMARSTKMRGFISAACLISLATLFKQVAILPALAICLLPTSHATTRRKLAVVSSSVALLWTLVFLYFVLTGRGELAWQTFVVAPRAYGGTILQQLTSFGQVFTASELVSLLPLLVLTILGVLLDRRHQWFLLALLAACALAIALPGHFWAHYLQLLILPLCLGTGYALAATVEQMPGKIAGVVAGIVLLGLCLLQSPSYQLPVSQWTERQYGGGYIILQDSIDPLRHLLKADETFFVWGDEAWMYHRLSRALPTAMVFRSHVVDSPVKQRLSVRVLQQLEENPPDLLLVREGLEGPGNSPIWRWLMEHYRPLPYDGRHYPLLRRFALEGSDLLKRAGD